MCLITNSQLHDKRILLAPYCAIPFQGRRQKNFWGRRATEKKRKIVKMAENSTIKLLPGGAT